MTIPSPDPIAYEAPEAPEVVTRNIRVGIRLGIGTTVFVFLGPLFAFLYLMQLDTGGQWRPAGVHPPYGFGWAVLGATVLSCALLAAASVRGRRGRSWRLLAGAALVLGLLSVVVHCVSYAHLAFGPTSGGYASVWFAWTGLDALMVLGTMFWLETLVAYAVRFPDAPPETVQPRLSALTGYWTFLGGMGLLMFVLLYLV